MSLSASTQTLGPYHLIRPLAHGSFAVIHLAMREGARELVALKELQHHTFGDPDSERRFRREAHLCALLDHTNVCRLLDAGADRDRFYIAFEYVPGVSLLRLMQRLRERDERLPHEVAVQIIAQTLDGLEHMHSRRGPDGNPLHLIHRDLKPSNIMLRFDGVVKIIDFGVAAARVDTHRTEAGRAMGTMAYMSPEQLRAEPLDHRSDLYAVGVILYELLTDRRLVDVNGYVELIDAVLHTKPPPLPSDIPDALEHVLNRALSKDRRQRWSNAAEFQNVLLNAVKASDRAVWIRLLRASFPNEWAEAENTLASLRMADAPEESVQPQFSATVAVQLDKKLREASNSDAFLTTVAVPIQSEDDEEEADDATLRSALAPTEVPNRNKASEGPTVPFDVRTDEIPPDAPQLSSLVPDPGSPTVLLGDELEPAAAKPTVLQAEYSRLAQLQRARPTVPIVESRPMPYPSIQATNISTIKILAALAVITVMITSLILVGVSRWRRAETLPPDMVIERPVQQP